MERESLTHEIIIQKQSECKSMFNKYVVRGGFPKRRIK